MTKYTSPTSSSIGSPRDAPPNQAALTRLEATVDAVRFRFEGLDSGIVQERPPTMQRSMAEITADMCEREESISQHLYSLFEPRLARRTAQPRSRLFFQGADHRVELGQFIQLRQESLGVLRKLTHKQWHQQSDYLEPGTATVLELAQWLAGHDAQALNELAALRQALAGDDTPGTAGVAPL